MDDLDRWTRVLPLGTGAFGEVHLAWDTVECRWVALKRFTGQDELGLLRMVIESRIRVSHPHLVRTLAFRLVDDRAWLVTELARGGSLRMLMTRTGALPWGWVAEVVDQLLSALAALHATGVVHRDLKPANLLLRSYGPSHPHLLVGDFGIATWRTVSMTGIGAAIGTPGYLSPEYLDGHQPSPATDLFAVGVLAAELLSGRRLVHYSNASPAIPSSWSDVLPVPPEVPHQLAAVLQRMAAPDPTRRYRDCTEAREALLAATPPTSRGNLTTVTVPDLLASVPPGWTPEGPEQPTTALPTPPPTAAPGTEPPNLVGLPIDGGPTELVLEDPATESPSSAAAPLAGWASGSSTEPPTGSATPASGSPASPVAGSPAPSASGSATQPPTGSATPTPGDPATPPPNSPGHPTTGSSTQPPTGSATSPAPPSTGSATSPPSGSATSLTTPPVSGVATPPPSTPSNGLAIPLATPPAGSPLPSASGSSTQPPTGSATSPTAKRKARKRRKAKQIGLLVVVLILAGAAGTVWWAATHRTIAGQASAAGIADQPEPTWKPTIVEPCSRVELDTTRAGANGNERCQYTQDTDSPQNWVEEPPGDFPKSNAAGPFPNTTCSNEGEKDYSPVGDHVACTNGTWQVIG